MVKKATLAEYIEIWHSGCSYADKLETEGHLIEGPWVKLTLQVALFKTMIHQKGWAKPPGFQL